MLPALACLLLEGVEPAFVLVGGKINGKFELKSLKEVVLEQIDLLASFSKMLSEALVLEAHTAPVFPPASWNQPVSAIDCLARINIAREVLQYGLQAPFQGSHPNVRIFLWQL